MNAMPMREAVERVSANLRLAAPPATTDVRYRTARGGRVPLSKRDQRDLLRLYSDHGRPVWEIAEIFGVSTGTIYRWLPLLGVRAQD